MGDRAFAVAGPRAWNKLPDSVRQSSSLDVFKRLLITLSVLTSCWWLLKWRLKWLYTYGALQI